ncbi:hypothetical protein PIB30_047347 [Stylosanthes scabra]|uniref:Uncharacterized protein n=1 Tax=Stylosanthes scabra TaxID=79078 RepID=A0ABU6TH39_9FABA|nr:hypothetical protein [Stylosanthes scabra]
MGERRSKEMGAWLIAEHPGFKVQEKNEESGGRRKENEEERATNLHKLTQKMLSKFVELTMQEGNNNESAKPIKHEKSEKQHQVTQKVITVERKKEDRSKLMIVKDTMAATEYKANDEEQIESHKEKNQKKTNAISEEENEDNIKKGRINIEDRKGNILALQGTINTKLTQHKTTTKTWKRKAIELRTTHNVDEENKKTAAQKRKGHDLTSMEVDIPTNKQKRANPTVESPMAEAARQPCRSP